MQKIISLLIILSLNSYIFGCNIPVFRYALERWNAEVFEAIIITSSNGLSQSEKLAVKRLQQNSFDIENNINLAVTIASTTDIQNTHLKDLFKDIKLDSKQNRIYLFHPRTSNIPNVIWQGPLTLKNVNKILYSDIRKQIADKICNGATAVYLMLESSNTQKNKDAWQVLQQAKQSLNKDMEIPKGIILHNGNVVGGDEVLPDTESKLYSAVPLKIDFQTLQFKASDDPILYNTISIMAENTTIDEPMVFAFFGQGRALSPLVGKEINRKNFFRMGYYICGACSCEVKSQNPGIDVPILCQWTNRIQNLTDNIDYSVFINKPAIEPNTTPKKTNSPKTIAIVLGLLIIFFVLIFLRRHRQRSLE